MIPSKKNLPWRNITDWFLLRQGGNQPDYTFIVLLFVLLVIGLVFLSSASSVIAYDQYGDAYYLFKQQLFKGVLFGLIFFFITSQVPYHWWRRWALPILILSLFLLVMVFVPGVGVEYLGGRRWLNLPGFTFQPSEMVKLALVIYLAAWFESRRGDIKSFRQLFIPFMFLLGIVGFLVMLQPDMGTTIIIMGICVSIYFFAGGNLWYIAGLGGLGATVFWLLITRSSYRAARLTIFLNPELDPQGIGYHINQAFLAIGSGGLFGRGLGHSRQKFNYLPEVASDSIFAVIAEELGYIFTVLFLLLYFYFFYRGLQIAQRAPDEFSKLLVSGIMAWVILQLLLNVMAMVGLIPLTGAPLPFISYGSSSLVILLAAMGMVVSISRHLKRHA